MLFSTLSVQAGAFSEGNASLWMGGISPETEIQRNIK
jgi:hypothetical protein